MVKPKSLRSTLTVAVPLQQRFTFERDFGIKRDGPGHIGNRQIADDIKGYRLADRHRIRREIAQFAWLEDDEFVGILRRLKYLAAQRAVAEAVVGFQRAGVDENRANRRGGRDPPDSP